MATIGRLSIAVSQVRDQVVLDGALDGANREFSIPNGEKAIHAPTGGIKIRLYHNTRRLLESEFVAVESGGAGSGVDLIRLMAFAPTSRSVVFADFIAL